LPLPAWDLVDIEKYVQKKFYSNRVITLNTSRGCPHRCAFCYNQAVNKRKWRGVSAEKIVEHVEFLMNNYDIKSFQMYDDEFDVNKKRVEDFCNLIIKKNLNISFSHFSRVNFADHKRYQLEKEAGLKLIEFGIESGSPRMLEFIRKDQTVDMIKNAFQICKDIKLETGALFMIGLPSETIGDVDKTVELVYSLGGHQTICTVFKPYPATMLYDYCVENELFELPDELEKQGECYDFSDADLNMSNIPSSYLKQIYKSFMVNNIKNELLLCIKSGNIELLMYYLKNKLNFILLARLIKR
jgi:radical SAM superfamily enzyme YgiQ (UPF0313 family)